MEKLQESVAKVDDEFKVKDERVHHGQGTTQCYLQESCWKFMTRDLGDLVQPSDLVETENLTTLCVAVPKFRPEGLDR